MHALASHGAGFCGIAGASGVGAAGFVSSQLAITAGRAAIQTGSRAVLQATNAGIRASHGTAGGGTAAGAASLQNKATHDEWASTSANDNHLGFTGHVEDSATGLTYMQARYYDPLIGRFLSPDPVGFTQGGFPYFNRYAYTYNDPVNAIDPTGMAIDCENMGSCPTSMYGGGAEQSANCGGAGTCGASPETVSPQEAAQEIMARERYRILNIKHRLD